MSNNDNPFSRRPTEPSRTAVRDPRATMQPTGEERYPPPAPATPAETPDSKQARSSRRGEPSMLDLLQAIEGVKSSFNRDLGDVKRELRMHGEEIDAIKRARSHSPVPALGAVALSSPPVAHPGNPSDVMVAVPSRVPSMTGDPVIDAQRLKAMYEADAQEDSIRYRSLAQELSDMKLAFKQLESTSKAQPAAAKEAAKLVADKAVEQTTALERMFRDKTFTNLVYMLVAMLVTSGVGLLANRASTKDIVHTETKEPLRDVKPTVVIVKDSNTTNDAGE